MKTIILCLVLMMICGGMIALSSVASETEGTDSSYAPTQEMESNENSFLEVPIGNILLEAPADSNTRRSPVDFPHSIHFTYTCYTCHHMWEGDGNLQTCTASGCHDQIERPRRTEENQPDPEEEIAYFKEAFHQLCITCHKEIQQQNLELELSLKHIQGKLPKGGPTSCVHCHPQ